MSDQDFQFRKRHVAAGKVANVPLHIVDMYPTLLKLAGASVDQSLPLDGLDAWPAIAHGESSPHKEILLNSTPAGGAIRVGDWKLLINAATAENETETADLTPDASRGAAPAPRRSVELFFLADDPYEQHDLAAENPQKVAELQARYDALARQAVKPRSAPKAPGFRSPRVWGERD